MVPINQRSYAWEDDQVTDLFQDFAAAIAGDDSHYFLGTVVLTHGESGIPEVADGQQRLATATILLAAIRDFLFTHDNLTHTTSIQTDYLMTTDLRWRQCLD